MKDTVKTHPVHPVKERFFRVPVLSFVEGFRVFRGLKIFVTFI